MKFYEAQRIIFCIHPLADSIDVRIPHSFIFKFESVLDMVGIYKYIILSLDFDLNKYYRIVTLKDLSTILNISDFI